MQKIIRETDTKDGIVPVTIDDERCYLKDAIDRYLPVGLEPALCSDAPLEADARSNRRGPFIANVPVVRWPALTLP
jgi:hypothetical protein